MTKEQFLDGVSNWDNHRILLWEALEATKDLALPVLELGCGDGSTPFLQQYCKDNGLELFSYDYNAEWAAKFGATHVTNWDNIPWRKRYGVVLVDESPGEHRKESLKNFIKNDNAVIIVVHDSEPAGWNASDYQVRQLFHSFNFVWDLRSETSDGAWATALSQVNYLDRPQTRFEHSEPSNL